MNRAARNTNLCFVRLAIGTSLFCALAGIGMFIAAALGWIE